MFKFLFNRKVNVDRLDRAVAHSHQREQQTVIRSRAGKIIADQRTKSLQVQNAAADRLSPKS